MGSLQPDRAYEPGEQRYRHLFENMPVGIIVADVTATPAIILEVNRRAELVYGYKAAELTGKPAADLVPEEVREVARASSVLVSFDIDEAGRIAVFVRDNGHGFDPRRLSPIDQAGHFGLRQMRERILDLGGTLDVHSAIGQGTELLITLPPLSKEVNHFYDSGTEHGAD